MSIRTIAFFNWRYPYGGGEVVTVQPGPVFPGSRVPGAPLHRRAHPRKTRALDTETLELRPLSAPEAAKANANKEFLIESIRQEKVDVIIVQGVMEFPSAAIRQATSCKVIFCLHNKPFWEIQFLREQKPSQIANPTLARRIEYLLLRRPVYWLTPKLKKRVTKDYARLLRSVDKCVLLCDEYRRDFDAALTARYGPEIIQGKTAAILNPLTPGTARPGNRETEAGALRRTAGPHPQTGRPAAEDLAAGRAPASRLAVADRRRGRGARTARTRCRPLRARQRPNFSDTGTTCPPSTALASGHLPDLQLRRTSHEPHGRPAVRGDSRFVRLPMPGFGRSPATARPESPFRHSACASMPTGSTTCSTIRRHKNGSASRRSSPRSATTRRPSGKSGFACSKNYNRDEKKSRLPSSVTERGSSAGPKPIAGCWPNTWPPTIRSRCSPRQSGIPDVRNRIFPAGESLENGILVRRFQCESRHEQYRQRRKPGCRARRVRVPARSGRAFGSAGLDTPPSGRGTSKQNTTSL